MTIDAIYGWAAGLGCLAACFSKSRTIESVALLLMGAWLASNIVYANVRQPTATIGFWMIDSLTFGLLTLTLWKQFRPWLAIFAATWLFLTVWDLSWYLWCPPSFYLYDLVSNIVFIIHLATLTAMSAVNRIATLPARA